jgi:hypothetical protein
MKNLVLGSLIAVAASQAAGCIITTDDGDNPNPNPNYATVGATWSFRTVAGGTATCPPGFDTVALFNQRVNAAGEPIGGECRTLRDADNSGGTCYVDLYDCVDGAGRSAPLPPARYRTWLAVTDDSVSQVYAESVSAYLDVRESDLTYNAQILVDGGYFYLSWDLVDAFTGDPLSCSEALADGVGVISTSVSNPNQFYDDKFTCSDGGGYTAGLLAGTYTVAIDAMEGDASVSPEPVVLTNKVINDQNRVTDLGHIEIPVD